MKLHTESSFSIYNLNDGGGEEDLKGKEERSVKSGGNIASLGSREFSFGRNSISLIGEDHNEAEDEEEKEQTLNEFKGLGIEGEAASPTPLSSGVAIDSDGVDGGGGEVSRARSFDENGDVEVYYKRMIREDPSNPLFLRNYAQLLQSKGDYSGAGNYYYRATLADPKDGEVVLQYAKLVRDFHHDKRRAINYFEKAAHEAPEDSHVLAAYASFLWEVEEDEEERSSGGENIKVEDGGEMDLHNSVFAEDERPASPPLHLATGLGIDMAGFRGSVGAFDYMKTDFGDGTDTEEYYKMMIEENPCNPSFLRNYAQFLCEIKGDFQAAEEYYSRAILADPSDGDILVQYAKLIWECHSDRQKASSFFEQAVRVASHDSNVLAAYARFLWESEEGNDEQDKGV